MGTSYLLENIRANQKVRDLGIDLLEFKNQRRLFHSHKTPNRISSFVLASSVMYVPEVYVLKSNDDGKIDHLFIFDGYYGRII